MNGISRNANHSFLIVQRVEESQHRGGEEPPPSMGCSCANQENLIFVHF